ncbi:MAG: MBOAT family protein [Microcystaceae cyanobacterium]
MLFTEFRFFPFFLSVFLAYWLLPTNKSRKGWLLICSYWFYAAWDWRFLSLIILSTVVDFWVGNQLVKAHTPQKARNLLLLSLVTNLGLLGFFKYFNFFVDSGISLFNSLGIPLNPISLQILLPVGISFYTFQTLSYSIDIYRGKLKPVKSLLDFAVFVSFFPQLVAGPIVRAADFLPQLNEMRIFRDVRVRYYLTLFLIGFIKKACISDRIAQAIDPYFLTPDAYNASSAWIATILYAIQIYCDFSGYTDMAIACAGLLGYELCLNFDFPYLSTNISHFWRRWHISLSTWLKDYLYIPLGGNRGGRLVNYRNLMITMVLGGLWHGAGWTFIFWGMIHGGGLIVHREWTRRVRPQLFGVMGRVISTATTFYWVCLGWIFFRASNFGSALTILKSYVLFEGSGQLELSQMWWLTIAGLALIHYSFSRRKPEKEMVEKWPNWLFSMGYGVAFAVAYLFIAPSYSPFIYFQF